MSSWRPPLRLLIASAYPRGMDRRELDSGLVIAAVAGDVERVELMLALGANPKAFQSRALLEAVGSGSLACAERLLPLSDPQARPNHAAKPAIAGNRADLLALLAPSLAPDPPDESLLELAAERGAAECLALLLSLDSPAPDPQAVQEALLIAAAHGNLSCVRLLTPLADPAESDFKALFAAAYYDRAHCLALMLASRPAPSSVLRRLLAEARREKSGDCGEILRAAVEAAAIDRSALPARPLANTCPKPRRPSL